MTDIFAGVYSQLATKDKAFSFCRPTHWSV